MSGCPCGSGREFSVCCGPYLAGAPAPTAEALMRSRYTAYTLGNFGYIEKTCTGPAAKAFDRAEAERSQLTTEWLGLDVRKTKDGGEGDTTGTVKFEFRYRHHGQEIAQLDVSSFRRIDGAWFYYDSDVKREASVKPTQNIGRNEPCRCGSGKKFKKCCGAEV